MTKDHDIDSLNNPCVPLKQGFQLTPDEDYPNKTNDTHSKIPCNALILYHVPDMGFQLTPAWRLKKFQQTCQKAVSKTKTTQKT